MRIKALVVSLLGVVVMTTAQADDCSMLCTMIYDPVCGSDGKTYASECVMKASACRDKASVSMQYKGECRTAEEEECMMMCPLNYDPICGSDGNTYSNGCEMQGKACMMKKKITMLHKGACDEPVPELYTADDECLLMCAMIYAPLCGSDGKTYGNECDMKSKACLAKKEISKSHDGPCDEDQEEPAECQLRPCPRIFDPVCASDGHTYPNGCEMENTACTSKKHLEVKHPGEC